MHPHKLHRLMIDSIAYRIATRASKSAQPVPQEVQQPVLECTYPKCETTAGCNGACKNGMRHTGVPVVGSPVNG